MSDEDVRALERAARAGDVYACLAWARALERSGRTDEATEARLLALDADPLAAEPRATLAAACAWMGTKGGPGRTRASTDEPLTRAPTLLWRVEPTEHLVSERTARQLIDPCLFGGWLGIVVRNPLHTRVDVLDARSGASLWSKTGWFDAGSSRIAGDAVLLREQESVVSRDVRTGAVLNEAPSPGGRDVTGWVPGLHLAVTNERLVWQLAAFDWPDPRRAPASSPRWVYRTSSDRRPRVVVGAGSLVLLPSHGGQVVALDVTTGAERWRVDGDAAVGDARGVVVKSGQRLVTYDPEGAERWSCSGTEVLALGASMLVAVPAVIGRGTSPITIHDRVTGELRAELARPAPSWRAAVAGDVLYLGGVIGLEAISAAGEVLWCVPKRELPWGQPMSLLTLPRRVIVQFADGTLMAFGESVSA